MPERPGEKTYYRTNEAAEAVGVSRRTLLRRFREKRVDDVKRDRNGWRPVTDGDIARLKERATAERAG